MSNVPLFLSRPYLALSVLWRTFKNCHFKIDFFNTLMVYLPSESYLCWITCIIITNLQNTTVLCKCITMHIQMWLISACGECVDDGWFKQLHLACAHLHIEHRLHQPWQHTLKEISYMAACYMLQHLSVSDYLQFTCVPPPRPPSSSGGARIGS